MLGLSVVTLAARAMGLFAAAVLLGSCTTAGDPPPKTRADAATSTINPAAQSAADPSAPTPKLLDFTAPKLGGGQVVGSELAGKDVAMFFWAPW